MAKKLSFFHGTPKIERSYEDFLKLAEEIIRQSRLLLSATEDGDMKSKLDRIIKATLKAIQGMQNKSADEVNQYMYELTEASLMLPADFSARNRLGSMSAILANLCLFVVALSIAWFTGYLFYAAFYATSAQAVVDTFLWTCAFDVIPFGLVGLFANNVSRSVNDKNGSVDELQTTIHDFCLSSVVGDLQVEPQEVEDKQERRTCVFC